MDGIERSSGGTMFTGNGIAMLRLTTMLRCLGLEIKGIKMVRHSVYAQAKRELGFKGNKQSVYNQLAAHVREKLRENGATDEDVESLLAGSR